MEYVSSDMDKHKKIKLIKRRIFISYTESVEEDRFVCIRCGSEWNKEKIMIVEGSYFLSITNDSKSFVNLDKKNRYIFIRAISAKYILELANYFSPCNFETISGAIEFLLIIGK